MRQPTNIPSYKEAIAASKNMKANGKQLDSVGDRTTEKGGKERRKRRKRGKKR